MLASCFVQANTPQFLGKANLRDLYQDCFRLYIHTFPSVKFLAPL